MKTVFTLRDPLWTACQRASYCNLVRRAAAGAPCFRDLAWLNTALEALGLSHMDYELDLAAVESGNVPPRLRGEWTEPDPVITRQVEDAGVIPIPKE